MDIVKLLSSIKGKVLDATHFDLLKHAYELQNHNIEQLKNNNEALRESNGLLQDKVARLEQHNESLRTSLEGVRARPEAARADNIGAEVSEVAEAILQLYRERDAVKLYEAEILPALPFSRIQIEAAFDDLEQAQILHIISIAPNFGKCYALTDCGKKYIVQDRA
jgi:predicted RNase H-like nuclease (RuvC/YqgF family)